MELRWITSAPASALHAVGAIISGQTLVDRQVAEALAAPAAAFASGLEVAGVEPARFLEHLVPLSAGGENPTQRARVAMTKAAGSQQAANSAAMLGRLIGAVESAFLRVYPSAAEELALRAEPLRGQWEARGPGLLATLKRLVAPELLVERADVVLVQPVLGGGGCAHWLYNSVRFEAVLANPIADLPEILRLGWLLAQLNIDVPSLHGELHRDRWLALGPLALVPAIVTAGGEVELCRADSLTIAHALQAWRLDVQHADALTDWWETYRATRPPWPVALAALDQIVTP